jgi:hypothetical protein
MNALLLIELLIQIGEHDNAFVAVERFNDGVGWLRICRHGQEKYVYPSTFSSCVGDIKLKGLDDSQFRCPVWRAADAARIAGIIQGRW